MSLLTPCVMPPAFHDARLRSRSRPGGEQLSSKEPHCQRGTWPRFGLGDGLLTLLCPAAGTVAFVSRSRQQTIVGARGDSRRLERNVEKLRRPFPILEAFGNNAECQGLNAGHRFITILPVDRTPGEAGISAIQRPSSSRSSSIVKVTPAIYHSPPGIHQLPLPGRRLLSS